MKQKLTITVDADLLPAAKRYARSRGVFPVVHWSNSPLGKWSGRASRPSPPVGEASFRRREREGDPRYDALAEKYLQ